MKPKYHFLNNARYALEGLFALFKNEMAFRIELCIIIPAIVFSFFFKSQFFGAFVIDKCLNTYLNCRSFKFGN